MDASKRPAPGTASSTINPTGGTFVKNLHPSTYSALSGNKEAATNLYLLLIYRLAMDMDEQGATK